MSKDKEPNDTTEEIDLDISREAYDMLMAECERTGETEGEVISRIIVEMYGPKA